MRQRLVAALVLLLIGACVWGAEEEILIRQGRAPILDGRVETAEWCEASGVRFCVRGSVEAQVLFLHDATFVYFAFVYGENPEALLLMPEIAIDTALDRGTTWAADDWWFHVSATDCEAKGRFDVYTACVLDHGDWSGVPNFSPSKAPAAINQFEIRIPLAKLGLSVGDSIGIAFCVLDPTEHRSTWPFAASFASPATWGRAALVGGTP